MRHSSRHAQGFLLAAMFIAALLCLAVNALTPTPGVNILTGNSDVFTFEGDYASYTGIFTSDPANIGSVQPNPLAAGNDSSSAMLLSMTNTRGYPKVAVSLSPSVEAERPVYVAFKYYKDYIPANGETPANNTSLWVMKNNASFIAQSVGGFTMNADTWKSYAGFPNFARATQAGKPDVVNTDNLSNIYIEAANDANPAPVGTVRFWFDDISIIPSYKVTFHKNDGTGEVFETKYMLFDDGGAVLSSYAPSTESDPVRFGYFFRGWSLAEDGEAVDTVSLAGADVDLYAVWEKDLDAPDPIEHHFDFETEDTYVFKTNNVGYSLAYENGMMKVDLGAVTDSTRKNPYLSFKANQNFDTRSYRYLFFNLSNPTGASNMKLYFITSDNGGWSETKTVVIPIEPNVSAYRTYVVDMSQNSLWTGNFINCMLTIGGATEGVVSFEDVWFCTYYDESGPEVSTPDYHFDLSNSTMSSTWGQHSSTYADGLLTVTRSNNGSAGGALYTYSIPDGTASVTELPYLIYKAKTSDVSGITGASVYFASYTYAFDAGAGESAHKTLTTEVIGDYTYFYINWVDALGVDGYYKRFMYQMSGFGTAKFCDIYLSAKAPENETGGDSFVIDKFTLGASASSITEDGGTVLLTPYLRTTNGVESREEDLSGRVGYAIDSICGLIAIAADGSATVTGKMNGSITVTAYLKDDPNLEKSVTIDISGQSEKIAAKKIKLATYGNSIHRHGVAESIGWYNVWGMAASAEEKDYVHRLIWYLGQKYGEDNVVHVWGQGQSSFETYAPSQTADYDYTDYLAGLTEFAAREKPDIVTVQYGENGGDMPAASWQNALTQFVEALQRGYPDTIVLITCPFWGGAGKVPGAKAAAAALDIPLADISVYGKAEYEAIGLFEHHGVSIHPGDAGMEAIAKLMFDRLNPYMTERIDPTIEYSVIPTGVTISGDTAITTADGTVQLTATVLPEGTSQEVVWWSSNMYIASVDDNGLVTGKGNGEAVITVASAFDRSLQATVTVTVSGQTPTYTVTYDKNTTDTVTNMPAPNEYAKEGFGFDAVYPVRDSYRFMGWALTPDGEVVDSVDVTEDITVYAVWEKATRWTFDRFDDKEGFTVTNGFNQFVRDGYFMFIATGMTEDAMLSVSSPVIDVNPADYRYLTLHMLNNEIGSATKVKLTVTTTTGTYSFEKPVTNTDYQWYEFDLANVTGTITGFTFLPTDVDCTINLDEVAFRADGDALLRYDANAAGDTVTGMPGSEYSSKDGVITLSAAVPARAGFTFLGWVIDPSSKLVIEGSVPDTVNVVYALWDKKDHLEFDKSTGYSFSNIDRYSIADGILTYDGGRDPIVETSTFGGFRAEDTSKQVAVRMKWNEDTNTVTQMFYVIEGVNTSLSEANSAQLTVEPSGDWQTVVIDFTDKSNFAGTLNRMRFDITAGPGNVNVDWIRFTDSEAHLVTASGETRRIAYDDDGKYVVRAGGTLAPVGFVSIDTLALGGDVDVSEGVLYVSGQLEIADDAPYAELRFDSYPDLGNASTVAVSKKTNTADVKFGGAYIIPLDENGNGMIFLDGAPYRVTKTTVEKIEDYCVVKDGGATVYLSDSTLTAGKVITAAYDESGRMVAAAVTEASNGEYEINFAVGDAAVTTVKAFFLDDNLAPVEAARVFSVIAEDSTETSIDIGVLFID